MLTAPAPSGASLWRVELARRRRQDWIRKAPHAPKLILLLCAAAVSILGIVTPGVRPWALAYWAFGLSPGPEPAVRFALVAFTTLRCGNPLLPDDWRLPGGMTATSGCTVVGVLVASLSGAQRQVRLAQIARAEAGRSGATQR
jgi:hypothetical protein